MGEVLKKRLKQESLPSEEDQALLNLLITSFYLRKDLSEIYAQYGLTWGQYNVLRILRGAHPDGHARQDIIERMVDPAPDVTRLVDRLVDDGYAQRYRSTKDARLSMTKITEKGLEKIKSMEDALDAYDLSEFLNKQECRKLSELCEKIYKDRVV